MKTNFTKGEWVISNNLNVDNQKYIPAYFVRAKGIITECSILPPGYGFTENQIKESKIIAEANAKLIAAAPQLLHALMIAVKHIKNIQEKYKPEHPFAIGLYEAAIKKATE